MDFLVFEQPEMTILSCHVEGSRIEELHSHLRVEIKSASDPSKIESVFPLPLSNFFQVKDLPKGKHLLQLQSGFPSTTHKFESEIIEVDLEKNTQIHVGPLRFKVEEDHHKQVCFTFFKQIILFMISYHQLCILLTYPHYYWNCSSAIQTFQTIQ